MRENTEALHKLMENRHTLGLTTDQYMKFYELIINAESREDIRDIEKQLMMEISLNKLTNRV